MKTPRCSMLAVVCLAFPLAALAVVADKPAGKPAAKKAFLDGTGPGWKALGADDFANVNCDKETWTWKGGDLRCTGLPIGVCRTKKQLTNFELVLEWRHEKSAGNS